MKTFGSFYCSSKSCKTNSGLGAKYMGMVSTRQVLRNTFKFHQDISRQNLLNQPYYFHTKYITSLCCRSVYYCRLEVYNTFWMFVFRYRTCPNFNRKYGGMYCFCFMENLSNFCELFSFQLSLQSTRHILKYCQHSINCTTWWYMVTIFKTSWIQCWSKDRLGTSVSLNIFIKMA